jgi:hypothetical protein
MPVSIAAVMAVVSPSWLVPPVETVCEPVPVPDFDAALLAEFVPVLTEPRCALLDPVPWVFWVLLAALLAEFVPVLTEPRCALLEPVPLFDPPGPLLFSFVPALLAELVPVFFEPLWPLFDPVPDFEPPFFDFEPVWLVFMSWPDCGLLPPCETCAPLDVSTLASTSPLTFELVLT